ncbi:MAG: PIN domain-containing protein [Chloroflexi bacterium]|nr:PIN domain-containing protein [Chloroflexota bacterium]
MPDRSFIDTNILVYAYDIDEPVKQARAREILKQGIEGETAVLSVQVIGEFFTVVTKRIPNPLSAEEAEQVLDLLSILPVIDLDFRMVRHAIEIHRQHGIAYWDALIVAAAHRAECTQILTEDLNAGQSYEGVTVVNPF